jgi:hypothetical protein
MPAKTLMDLGPGLFDQGNVGADNSLGAIGAATAAAHESSADEGKTAVRRRTGGKHQDRKDRTEKRNMRAAEKNAGEKSRSGDGAVWLCRLNKVAVRKGKDSLELLVDGGDGPKLIGLPIQDLEQVLRDLQTAIRIIRTHQ